MFIGHFAVAFAGKRIAPKTSLGILVLSTIFVDVLWPFFIGLGLEHVRIDPGNTAFTPLDFYHYPYSHSLVASFAWAIFFGGVYLAFTGYRRGAVITGLGVLSHWVLDFLTHRADLPLLLTDGPKVGLGLWNSIPATLAVEAALFVAGTGVYLLSTRAMDRTGSLGFWVFVGVLVLIYLGNVFGPPPPSPEAIVWMGPVSFLFFLFPHWIDQHRKP